MSQTETAADEAIRPLRLHDRPPDRLRTITSMLADALEEARREGDEAANASGEESYIIAACSLVGLRSTVAACITLLQRECGR